MRALSKIFALTVIAGGVTGAPAVAQTAASMRTVAQPSASGSDLTIVRSLRSGADLGRLPVIRRYDLATLRAQPTIMLGARRINLAPMLNDTRSLMNVGARLQRMPQQVRVTANTTQVLEVAQGLLIRQDISFSILPGQCANAASRSAIEASGVHCLTRIPLAEHLAAFGRRGDRRYIADAGRRTQASAAFQRMYTQHQAQVDQSIAAFRQALRTRRADAVAKVGADKVARIEAMSDDQLKDEIGNTAQRHAAQSVLIPRDPTGPYAGLTPLGSLPSQPVRAASPAGVKSELTDADLGSNVYLTGFTYGDSYQWNFPIDVTIDPCTLALDVITDGLASLFGLSACPFSADATPYAGFNYGFGLRFPIRADLTYHRKVSGPGSYQANVTATFAPFDGSAADYASTGLDPGKVFDGKELVAQAGVDAGLTWDLPIVGSGGGDLFRLEKDFTQGLPSPFTNGQFAPPAPGKAGLNGDPIVFDQVDLLGDSANFGFVGAQIFPAIEVGLESQALTFDLVDHERSPAATTKLTYSGQTVPIAADAAHGFNTNFTFGNPVYNVGFRVTPGLDLHLFVDLGIWSDSWDPAIWFPQLAVVLPPGGVDFSCHAGTICTRDYAQTGAAAVQIASGPVTAAQPAKLRWAKVHFHQNGDGKDWDTEVDLMLKDGGGNIVAQSHLGKHTDFGDDTTTQDYDIIPTQSILRSDLLGSGSFDMVISPNGHDHWNYTAYVTIGWDDGKTYVGHVTNYVDQNYTGRSAKFRSDITSP